jgi:hypothetical protein
MTAAGRSLFRGPDAAGGTARVEQVRHPTIRAEIAEVRVDGLRVAGAARRTAPGRPAVVRRAGMA